VKSPPVGPLFNNHFPDPPPSPTLLSCRCGVKSSEWGLAGPGSTQQFSIDFRVRLVLLHEALRSLASLVSMVALLAPSVAVSSFLGTVSLGRSVLRLLLKNEGQRIRRWPSMCLLATR
jgi:hypothetical protein